jgi:hypothetical protein
MHINSFRHHSSNILCAGMSNLTKSIAILVAHLLLPATAHAASEAGVTLGVKAVAPRICGISSAVQSRSTENMLLTSGGHVTVKELLDENTGRIKPAVIDLSVAAVCNTPHQIRLKSEKGALRSETLPDDPKGTFLKDVKYRAILRWGASTTTLIANGAGTSHEASEDIQRPVVGDLNVEIRVDGTDNDLSTPLLEGAYTDVLTITVTALP